MIFAKAGRIYPSGTSEIVAPSNCGSASRNASIGSQSGVDPESIGIHWGNPFGPRSALSGSVRGPFRICAGSVQMHSGSVWGPPQYKKKQPGGWLRGAAVALPLSTANTVDRAEPQLQNRY